MGFPNSSKCALTIETYEDAAIIQDFHKNYENFPMGYSYVISAEYAIAFKTSEVVTPVC